TCPYSHNNHIPASSVLLQTLIREHGSTVGIVRDLPVLVTRDLDLMKQVLVKDFNNFVNRSDSMPTKSLLGKGVFYLRDYTWKRVRQLMSPSFSTGKLKRVSHHIQEAAGRLSRAFENCAHAGTRIKLFHVTGQYSTSIIAKTAFGVDADSIGEETDDQFTHSAKNIFKKRSKREFFFLMILMRFRKFRSFLVHHFGFHFADPCTRSSDVYFNAILKESIAEREVAERQGSRHVNNDFLQSLVSIKVASEDASSGPSKSAANSASNFNQNEEKSGVPAKKTMTMDEVIAQSLITIIAAYETTASTLQFCLFELAKNPEIQEEVFQEILDIVEDENPTYEELGRLCYMDQVVNETLRMYPPLPYITRLAQESRTYGTVTIPAGSAVYIPITEVHRDPSQYPNPDVFDPQRFSDENKAARNPLAFIPFGQGPRICIGMRLAYLELKTALVKVLR
ncbi:hypothetical protein EGW08_021910, partial [Elysia chlorotica]